MTKKRPALFTDRLSMFAAALLLLGLFTVYASVGLFVFARTAVFLLGPGLPAVWVGIIGFFAFSYFLIEIFAE